jgi:outer membrane protein assembly factor BamB
MHRTVMLTFIFILLAFGEAVAQDAQKKLPTKSAARKPSQKGADKSKPSPPPGSTGWTQWGGPNRNFTSDSKGLASSWPAAGPRKLWTYSIGDGYSGIAVDGGALYTMYRRPAKLWQLGRVDQEVVVALDANSGKTLWEFGYDAPHLRNMDMQPGPGPDSMPMVIGDRLYSVGVTGKLHCLDKRTGKLLWSHDLYEEFHGTVLTYGYSCQPLAYGNTLILMVGGRGHALMAFIKTMAGWFGKSRILPTPTLRRF